MREIKFKAWLPAIKKMTYEHTLEELMNWNTKIEDNGTAIWLQFTGLRDKNGKEVYEGDILRIRRPVRDTQTHYGENIPLGSYMEPMEPIVAEEIVSVIFDNGVFGYIQTADKPYYTGDDLEVIPLVYVFYEIVAANEDELKELFSGNWGHRILEGWEEDKEYLFETYEVGSVEELLNYIGVEVIGNQFEHPELLERKGRI